MSHRIFYVCYTWAISYNISPKELQCHCFNWSYNYDQQGALLTFLLTSTEVQINPEFVTLIVKSNFVMAVRWQMYKPYFNDSIHFIKGTDGRLSFLNMVLKIHLHAHFLYKKIYFFIPLCIL